MPACRIAYIVHDLNDPAVARRVTMLQAAGAQPVVIGFHRGGAAPSEVEGAPAIDLGRTGDARLIQRALMVAATLLRPATLLAHAAGADVVIGRNLEALALAARARSANPGARLVYECLDIHRTLLATSVAARLIQWIEARLLAAVDLLIVSSPAFIRHYFSRRPSLTAPALLVENKLLAIDRAPPAPAGEPAASPWKIGWFGNLRCARTLAMLADLAIRLDGRCHILIAGRPSPAVFPDFEEQVRAAPHCTYIGPFQLGELPSLYARCHFAWAIDYFEEGLNSRWLLPNRLYEASSFGVVPIALRSVETGEWLDRHGAGVLLDDKEPVEQLAALLGGLDAQGYAGLREMVAAIPRGDLIADRTDCERLLTAMTAHD